LLTLFYRFKNFDFFFLFYEEYALNLFQLLKEKTFNFPVEGENFF
jgi:hypothetical protein